jgi:hypothetical protein
MKKFSLVAALLLVPMITFAKDTERQMQQLTEWAGPFEDTVIAKYFDYSEGIACYVYAPRSISSSRNCNAGGCATHFNGDIGSISCVKVGSGVAK